MRSRAAIQTVVDQPLIVDEIEIPDPLPHQVVLKLSASGVCHSQLHQMHGEEYPRPTVFGHEGVGVVTHVGRDVRHLAEGDHAIVTWVPRTPIVGRKELVPTGVTYREELLHGGVYTWGEDALAKGDAVVKIEAEQATPESSIVGCAVLTGAGAVLNTAGVRPGDSVAVFGVGGVGLCAIQMAALLHAYPIIAVDLMDEKLEFAKEFGATHVVNASEVDAVEAVTELSGGGVDYAFDAIGLAVTNQQILSATRAGGHGADNHGGVAVLIGIPNTEITVDPMLFVLHQKQYRGSLGATYPDKDFAMFLRWAQEGKFPLDKMVTRSYNLDDVNRACDDLESGQIFGRAILKY